MMPPKAWTSVGMHVSAVAPIALRPILLVQAPSTASQELFVVAPLVEFQCGLATKSEIVCVIPSDLVLLKLSPKCGCASSAEVM